MAKPFKGQDARRLITELSTALEKLDSVQNSLQADRDGIGSAAEKLVAQEVLNTLREMPVEDIGREKKGLRLKSLREGGYRTVADLEAANVYSVASVPGISRDAAYTIKRLAKDIAASVQQGTKIRLSTDNRTEEATELIFALAQYRKKRPIADECKNLLFDYQQIIQYASHDLSEAAGSLKWLFSSGKKRQKAVSAYETLSSLRNGDFGHKASQLLYRFDAASRMSSFEAWADFAENSIQFFNTLETVMPGLLGNGDSVYGLPEELARDIEAECFFPDGLLCELRRYQEWGVKYALHQEKVLLGDEMGLGKTVQAIATMVSLRNTGATHFVVVCPASVITNWCREIQQKSRLRVTKVYGSGRQSALRAWKTTGGVAVTNYETTGYFTLEEGFRFSMLTVDEAHYIKNAGANRTKNVKQLCEHAERLLFMTGTALENKVDEMVSLIDILRPQIARQVRGVAALTAAPQFRQTVAPVYYRRKREQVLTELPELIETIEWCILTRSEENAYRAAVLSKNFSAMRRVSWNVDDIANASKAERLRELVEEAASEGRKVIVFSFFLETIRKVLELLGDRCMNPINGSVTPQRRQEIIDEFDSAPAGAVLAAQIQSGGTGLNIQSASVIILCEPQLKPSIENQAISRAYRLGQTRNVLVYRLLCVNTVDEKILKLLEEKQAVFNAFADKSDAAKESLELDDRSQKKIIEEEIERINALNDKNGNSD